MARRVKLPWAAGAFDFSALNSNALLIMRRSIVWAAAPIGVARVRITLQVGSASSGRVVTQTRTLNLPEVEGDQWQVRYMQTISRDHMRNFFDCVRSRETPASDIFSP